MVDSADIERLPEAREELFGILNSDEMRNVPVVVLANKQDLPSECTINAIYTVPLFGKVEFFVSYFILMNNTHICA